MEWSRRRERRTRTAVLVALGVTVALVIGLFAALRNGDTNNDVIASENSVGSTTTTTPPTTTPVFVAATASSTPGTTSPPVIVPATTVAATTTVAPTTTIVETTTTAPTDTLPAQPDQPIAPPPDPRGFEEQNQVGTIAIPKLGVDEPLLEGIRLTTLDNGPGHWPGTAMPGEVGNVVVAAHRTSHGAPFRHIDQLVEGDTVEFTTSTGVSEYTVTGTEVVTPDSIWIVNPTDTPTATLFACHPPGSVAYRFVVHLELT